MKTIDILHINHNSSGTEGLYEDGIYRTLHTKYNQVLFVNSEYPLDYGFKLFYRFSNCLKLPARTLLLQAIKYFELLFDWIYIIVYIYKNKPKYVNHSLLSRFMLPERLFVMTICKIKGVSVILTCHDVIPFGTDKKRNINRRAKVFNKVDYLLVHSKSSINDLVTTYNIDRKKIIYHPFPPIDFFRIIKKQENSQKKIDFLFTGFIRKEKGLHILLEAWKQFHENNKYANMVVAGAVADNYINFDQYKDLNIKFMLSFQTQEEFIDLLFSSFCVVLPYTHGTNSGILYSAIAANCSIISSNIAMFQNIDVIDKDDMFINNDVADLVRLLEERYKKRKDVKNIKDIYMNKFEEQTITLYDNLFNENNHS